MTRELKTGLVAVAAIALFIWGYNFLKGQNILNANHRYFYVEYDNIRGLKKASTITINGLAVGNVVDITFNDRPEKRGKLVVKILIDKDFEFSVNSVAKIYSGSLMGGQSLAIIPSFKGETAKSGDYLKGEVESDIFASVGEKLNPLQAKLENVIVSADSMLVGINQVLNAETRKSLVTSIKDIEYTIKDVKGLMGAVKYMVDSSKVSLQQTIENTNTITGNFAQISDSLVAANLGQTVQKMNMAMDQINQLVQGFENGDGTVGKLMKDDALYTNLTNMTKEMEELMREMKLNPKRFVHFSLFGKKPKPYNQEANKKNESNQ